MVETTRDFRSATLEVLLLGEIAQIGNFIREAVTLPLEEQTQVVYGFASAISALMQEHGYQSRIIAPVWELPSRQLSINADGDFTVYDRAKQLIYLPSAQKVTQIGSSNNLLHRLATAYFELAIM